MMLQWLRRRRDARRLAQVDSEALVRDHGAEAYGEARRRERDVVLPDGTPHALIVARMTGKRVGLDSATRMAMDSCSFSKRDGVERPERGPKRKLTDDGQSAALKRILKDQ